LAQKQTLRSRLARRDADALLLMASQLPY
jgi:hypothetical protein